MAPTTVTVTRDANIGLVTLDGAARLNPLSSSTLESLADALAGLSAEPAIRTVVITGAGTAFSAGADIDEIAQFPDGEAFARHLRRFTDILAGIEACPRPVIAAVNGAALGGGLELMLACDLSVAATDAKLGVPEIRLGLLPGAGGTQRLARGLPPAIARELLLTGRSLTGQRAYELGLVNRTATAGSVMEQAIELCRELVAGSSTAAAAAKRLLRASADRDLAAGIDLERETVQALYATPDATEGVRAFTEKRRPRFAEPGGSRR